MLPRPDHTVRPILAFSLLTRRQVEDLERSAREHVTRMNEEELTLAHDVSEVLERLTRVELERRRQGDRHQNGASS
jgi:hypothetical protein